MNFKKLSTLVGAILIIFATVVCSSSAIPLGPTATPEPTNTPQPTSTPRPTNTPQPTATPNIQIGDWVDGHFWSVKVVKVDTATELDGIKPQNDQFLLVDVQWKANGLTEMHSIEGVDFMLVDKTGKEYAISGMIYESGTFASFSDKAQYQKSKWRISRVSGSKSDTYRLVFDMPSNVNNLKLWFRDLTPIDLGL